MDLNQLRSQQINLKGEPLENRKRLLEFLLSSMERVYSTSSTIFTKSNTMYTVYRFNGTEWAGTQRDDSHPISIDEFISTFSPNSVSTNPTNAPILVKDVCISVLQGRKYGVRNV